MSDSAAKYEAYRKVHGAFERGDLEALKAALDDPPGFPNETAPWAGDVGAGNIILEYAIYHSPFSFLRTLLDLGADPNYREHAGFPSLIAALTTDRADRYEVVELLLSFGADIQQRGVNDYTPLHYAVAADDGKAMELLLAHGADPQAKTRIDEYATPLEEAEILGLSEAAETLRKLTAG